jgi:hypothetical protein
MRPSADFWPVSTSITAAHRRRMRQLIQCAVDLASETFVVLRQAWRSRRAHRTWREDLPWNAGMDHLAETGYTPFIPRGN